MALTAWMLLAAVGACAEGLPQTIGNDPLTRQILSKAAQENGGVTAAVRLGTGQTIELELAPAASSPPPAAVSMTKRRSMTRLNPATWRARASTSGNRSRRRPIIPCSDFPMSLLRRTWGPTPMGR